MALFCSAIRGDYISLFKFSFLWHTQVFSCEISLIWEIFLLLLFTPLEFFTSVLADGFLLEFEWQQVSSSL